MVSLGVLIATGAREDGHRIVAVEVADTESEATKSSSDPRESVRRTRS